MSGGIGEDFVVVVCVNLLQVQPTGGTQSGDYLVVDPFVAVLFLDDEGRFAVEICPYIGRINAAYAVAVATVSARSEAEIWRAFPLV